MLFITTVIVVAVLTGIAVRIANPSYVRIANNHSIRKKIAVKKDNLVNEQSAQSNDSPITLKNFGTYRFKDPFAPLVSTPISSTSAVSTTTSPTASSTTSSTTNTGGSSNNLAPALSDNLQANKIYLKGQEKKAVILFNNRALIVKKSSIFGSYKVLDVSLQESSVTLLKGDEQLVLTKSYQPATIKHKYR